MEVYILDSLYRRIEVVDRYESLIWAERFSSKGDFELNILSTLENRNRFIPGVMIAIDLSYRVMTIETVQDITDDEGRRMLKITGPSLEAILEQRLALADLSDLTTDPKWILTGLPQDIATQMFHDICITGILDTGDIIPSVTEGSIFPADTIGAPSDSIVYAVDPKTLYLGIKELCDNYAMGFRLVRDLDTSMLYFDIYMGSDRTTGQTGLAAVVFSPDLENLRNTNKLSSSALYKNTAYVMSPVGHEIVYELDFDPVTNGFARRILLVKADDITDVVPADATAKMIARGKEELAKNRRLTSLDGEITTYSQYIYGVDYNLGDLVELRDDDGTTSKMQVTEQIFVADKEGNRAYPTLSVNLFITPGSWLAWDYSQEWDDLTTEEWEDQP